MPYLVYKVCFNVYCQIFLYSAYNYYSFYVVYCSNFIKYIYISLFINDSIYFRHPKVNIHNEHVYVIILGTDRGHTNVSYQLSTKSLPRTHTVYFKALHNFMHAIFKNTLVLIDLLFQ